MASYVLTVVGYPAAESTGTFERCIAGAQGLLAAGRGTITGSGHTAAWRSSGSPITRYSRVSRRCWPRTIRSRPRRHASRSCAQSTMLKILTSSGSDSRRSHCSTRFAVS